LPQWYLPVGSTGDTPIEPPRVHHAARRRGGVIAANGARAAASEGADHWVPWTGHAFGLECMDSCLCSATARTRLDRGSHRGDRVSLGGGVYRALWRDCRRVCPITVGGAVLAAKEVTSVIPIVFAAANDPVGTGLVPSLARLGGNVTGLSSQAADLA